jgi:hypothetical protein
MTRDNHKRRQQAREYMARHGVSYTAALRELDADALVTSDARAGWEEFVPPGEVGPDDAALCDDCGVPTDRHGSDCGYYADEEYGNPEWGRPGGWVDSSGHLVDVGIPRAECRRCRRGLTVTEAYDLAGEKPRRCWIYACASAAGCGTEHVYLPGRGLLALPPREEDDTEIDGTPVSLALAGDPLVW